MELQGKVIAVLPERSGTSARGEWKSQEYVIDITGSQYPRHFVFTVFGADRIQRFNIQMGQEVLVAFDIDAHEWNGRWFNDIRAYDVRPAAATQPVQPVQNVAPQQSAVAPQQSAAAPQSEAPAAEDDDDSQLPF